MILAAAVQLCSSSDREANLRTAAELIHRAAGYGAQVVSTPENTNFLGCMEDKVSTAEDLRGVTCATFSELADSLNIYLMLGSFNEKCEALANRCFNTSVLFGPDGSILATYRKLHLMDVDLPGVGNLRESDAILPGNELKVVNTPFGCWGLSICYDLRFPELYRQLVEKGAEVLFVPSAFTLMTGKDHWEPLLRARAIECQSYVLAPAQCGPHDERGERVSYGHSMVIDPWGHIVARASDGPGIALAEVDLSRVADLRQGMRLLEHRRIMAADVRVRPVTLAGSEKDPRKKP